MRLSTQNYSDFLKRLQHDELHATDIDKKTLYLKMLAAFMHENDLIGARYLYKRIPLELRASVEVAQMFKLVRALWTNSFEDFFEGIAAPWSDAIKPVVEDLERKVREDTIMLISQIYSSIYEDNLLKMMQMKREELMELCALHKWTTEMEGDRVVVYPKPIPPPPPPLCSSKQQLMDLTSFVSYLEN